MSQKSSKNYISFFYVKKTIKECPMPLDISIKSNRKHHKTVLYSKSNKNMVGRLFGWFFVVFWRFFHKNIWSPCSSWKGVWIRCIDVKDTKSKKNSIFYLSFKFTVKASNKSNFTTVIMLILLPYRKRKLCKLGPGTIWNIRVYNVRIS